MAGANPASPGTPGRVGETRHSAGATRHWRGTRNAAPTCRRCGGTAAVGGRCTAPGTVRHVAFFGAAGAHQRAAGGLRGTFRDFAGAPATAGRGAGCRGAPPRGGREAEQTFPGLAGNPGDREGQRAESARGRCRERHAAAAALDGSRIGIEGRTAALPRLRTTCCKAPDGPSKFSDPTPVPVALRGRGCGRPPARTSAIPVDDDRPPARPAPPSFSCR